MCVCVCERERERERKRQRDREIGNYAWIYIIEYLRLSIPI